MRLPKSTPLFVLALAVAASAKSPIPIDERAAQDSFRDVKLLTAQAEYQAEKLGAAIAAAQFSPESARQRLEDLRTDINAIGQNMNGLLHARQLLPMAEREALLKAIPALEDAASNARLAIQSYNESSHAQWFQRNRNVVKRIQVDTERAHEVLARAQKLESTIEGENRAAIKLSRSLNN